MNYYGDTPQSLIDEALAAVNVDVWRLWDEFLLHNFDQTVKTVEPGFFHQHATQNSAQSVDVQHSEVTKFITVWAWDKAPILLVEHTITPKKIEWIVTRRF